MMIINNNNNGSDQYDYTDNEERKKSFSFFELAGGVPKRTVYVQLCLTLGMFGIHELYVRRAVRAILFFIFGAVSFFSGMVLFIPNLLKYLAEEKVCCHLLYIGIGLISIAIITFIVCIISALKWMFFNNDDDFEKKFRNNSHAPLNK